MELGPVTLDGTIVRLEPLRPVHTKGLWQIAQNVGIWTWMSQDLSDRQVLEHWIQSALNEEHAQRCYAFAVVERDTGQILGSTRYLNIHREDRGVEIGSTWYTPRVWGTVVNPEAKWLLMNHAFESWGALRVELRTDHLNQHSKAAIRKLGAVYEGMLRNHRVRRDGSLRHTAVFSILPGEWPQVSDHLQSRIMRHPE